MGGQDDAIRELEKRVATVTEKHRLALDKVRVYERILYLFADPWNSMNFEEMMDATMEVTRCEAGSILLVDPEQEDLYFVSARGPKALEVMKYRVPIGKGIAGAAAESGDVIAVSEVGNDPRFYREISESLGFETRSILAVPVKYRSTVVGVIELINKKDGDVFSKGEVDLVERIARMMGILVFLNVKATYADDDGEKS